MSLFGTLFGGDTTNNQTTKSSGTSSTQTDQTTTSHGTSTTTGSSSSSVMTLDPATIAMLQSLTGEYASQLGNTGTDAASLRSVAGQLVSNATNSSQMEASIAANRDEATREFNTGEGTRISGLTQQIGSKGNTFAQLLEQGGSSDLQTQLAKVASDAMLQQQQNETAGLSAAANVYTQAGQTGINEANAPLDRLMSIMAMLKGADTESNASNTSTTIEDMISHLTGTSNTQTSGTQNTTGNGTNNGGGVVGGVGQILSLFG